MKITLEPTDYLDTQFVPPKVTVEVSDESDIHKVMEVIGGALVAWGFHPNSVVVGMEQYAEERTPQKEERERTEES